jgi:hypothetical protein
MKGFNDHMLPFDEALVSLEYGEWLVRRNRAEDAESLLDFARATFDRLGAAPLLQRAVALAPPSLIST